MYNTLHYFLEAAMFDAARVEVQTKYGKTFSGTSAGLNESDDDLGWDFFDIEGWPYDMIHFKDIASVKRPDTGEACAAPQAATQK